MLVDPTKAVSAKQPKGFRGRALVVIEQHRLFRGWVSNDPAAHPHEDLAGILGMLHGASGAEVRLLRVDDIDGGVRAIRLGKRPHPMPLDPVSWTVLERCIQHRGELAPQNPMSSLLEAPRQIDDRRRRRT